MFAPTELSPSLNVPSKVRLVEIVDVNKAALLALKLPVNIILFTAVLPAVNTCCKLGITVGIVYHSTCVPVLVNTCPAVPIEFNLSYKPPVIFV